MNLRMQLSERNEQVVHDLLVDLGLTVQPFGQGMWTDAVREMLRGIPEPQRWAQDFVVRTPRGRAVYVDAKYSFGETANHSIEMRSLLVAGMSTMPTFYVCTFNQAGLGGVFTDPTVVHYQEIGVVGDNAWPCCYGCREKFLGPDPMRNVPERCPTRQHRGYTASGTPFFVARGPFKPLGADMFDVEPYFVGPAVLRHWDRNVVVRDRPA